MPELHDPFFEPLPSLRSPAFGAHPHTQEQSPPPLTAVFSPEAFQAESSGARRRAKEEEKKDKFVSEPPWSHYEVLVTMRPR